MRGCLKYLDVRIWMGGCLEREGHGRHFKMWKRYEHEMHSKRFLNFTWWKNLKYNLDLVCNIRGVGGFLLRISFSLDFLYQISPLDHWVCTWKCNNIITDVDDILLISNYSNMMNKIKHFLDIIQNKRNGWSSHLYFRHKNFKK